MGPERLIDAALPSFDYSEYHSLRIAAPEERVYTLARNLDFDESFVIRTLMRLRGYGGAGFGRNFVPLLEQPGREFVVGLVGRFWTAGGGLVRVAPEAFLSFQEPGYAKAVLNFRCMAEGDSTVLSTETRVMCLGEAARRRFGLYWFFIRPFSGWIRMEMLRGIKRKAEARP